MRFKTDEMEDFTMVFTLADRVPLRLRAETRSQFNAWRRLFEQVVPPARAPVTVRHRN